MVDGGWGKCEESEDSSGNSSSGYIGDRGRDQEMRVRLLYMTSDSEVIRVFFLKGLRVLREEESRASEVGGEDTRVERKSQRQECLLLLLVLAVVLVLVDWQERLQSLAGLAPANRRFRAL